MPRPREQIRLCTSRDGTRIAYAIRGKGSPLVWTTHWVHNLKFDWDSPIWRPWLEILLRHHTVITYDWRGCGLSDREGVDLSFERHVDDLEAVIGAAGINRFTLIGMVNGAAVSMAYTRRHAERVSQLVLYASYARGRLVRDTTPSVIEEARTRLKVIELGWPNESPGYGQFFTSLHLPDASPEQMRSYNEMLRQATSPATAAGLLKTFFGIDLRETARLIRCPTLVLHSRDDAVIPLDEGRDVAALIPQAHFVPLESRNHLVLSTEPAWHQLTDELDNFFASAPIAASGVGNSRFDQLTAREREILEVVAQGLDNNAIAKRFGISDKTVRNQVSAILGKLEVDSRVQAVVRAREAGFGHKGRE